MNIAPQGWEALEAAFREDRVKPVPLSPVYRLALLAVAFLMVLLPLVYLGLIGVVVWATWWHATHDLGFGLSGEGRGVVMTLLLYVTPLFAGIVLVFFLIKPLFVKRAAEAGGITLAPGEEPLLEHFVEKVARVVGAPTPKAIELDCRVNAAAAFRSGLASLFRGDLKLIIGLPLAAGMTLRSFGGVLAHEFGHFGQGAGMRLTYVIRTVNAWFARVVFERDAWDARLDDWGRNAGDFRLMLVVHLARAMVWVTRKILFGLMWIGHVASSYAMRQMEFDADRYEALFAGSETFGKTCRRLHELNAGMGQTLGHLQAAYQEKRLSRDVPELARLHAEALPVDAREEIGKMIAEGKTGLFDSHPCDRERIASAEALAAPGLFTLEEPATGLFRDFAAQAERVTHHFYEVDQDLNLTDVALQNTGELFQEGQQLQARAEAYERVFQSAPHPYRVTNFAETSGTNKDLRAALDHLTETINRLSSEAKAYDSMAEKWGEAVAIDELLRAGFQVKGKYQSFAEFLQDMAGREETLRPLDEAIARFVALGLNVLPDQDREKWTAVFHLLADTHAKLLIAEGLVTRQMVLINNADSAGNLPQQAFDQFNANGRALVQLNSQLATHYEMVRYPLPHKYPAATMATVFRGPAELSELEFVKATQIAANALSSIRRVQHAGLCRVAAEVERFLAANPA